MIPFAPCARSGIWTGNRIRQQNQAIPYSNWRRQTVTAVEPADRLNTHPAFGYPIAAGKKSPPAKTLPARPFGPADCGLPESEWEPRSVFRQLGSPLPDPWPVEPASCRGRASIGALAFTKTPALCPALLLRLALPLPFRSPRLSDEPIFLSLVPGSGPPPP